MRVGQRASLGAGTLRSRGQHPKGRGSSIGPNASAGRRGLSPIFASAAFVDRHGRPNSPADLACFSVVEFTDDIASLPAARWMKSHAPDARIAARCSNVPSVHLAIKSGAGLAPLPAVYASADRELVTVLGPIPELDYPIFLLAHKDIRRLPRVSAVFEFCVRELKPVLTRGEMKRSPQGDH
jgi:DNA-binding transcriptional LysR family regulator